VAGAAERIANDVLIAISIFAATLGCSAEFIIGPRGACHRTALRADPLARNDGFQRHCEFGPGLRPTRLE
jgi:hypothetical protein